MNKTIHKTIQFDNALKSKFEITPAAPFAAVIAIVVKIFIWIKKGNDGQKL